MTDERHETIHDLYDRLHGDARTNPIPEHVMDVRTKEGLNEARQLIQHAINQGWTTQADLARRTGYKPSAISEFKNNKWGKRKAGIEATVASDLAKAINQILRERDAKDTEVAGFVKIRVAEAIFDIVQYAIKRRRISVFVIPAGSGKTMALRALKIEIPGAILITVKRARGTVKSFLQLWARELGLGESGRAEDIQDRIVKTVAGTNRLMLIDEAHKLSVPALDAIREIWDEARIPIIMAATPVLHQTITGQRIGSQAVELMDQFYSRVAMFRDLTNLDNPETGDPEPRVSIEDIRKVFARGHVRLAKDGVRFLCRLANTNGAGGLRVCVDLVQIVVDLYPGDVITSKLLGDAMVTRLGIKEAGFRMETAEIATPAPPAAATA